jgi:hypothetical protein
MITSEADLAGVMDCTGSGKHFLLSQSIAITSAWTPLGSSVSPFIGIFNGGGHTISGVVIEDHTPNEDANIYRDGVGLFRAVQNSVFENFQLDVRVAMTSFQPLTTIDRTCCFGAPIGTPEKGVLQGVGALSGWADNSTFRNIESKLRLDDTPSVSGYIAVGGLVGYAKGKSGFSGGTGVGTNKLEFFEVRAQVDYRKLGTRGLGGLVGEAWLTSGKTLVISESSAAIVQNGSGSIAGSSSEGSGGLVGRLIHGNLSIKDSYAITTMNLAPFGTKVVGGLVGMVPTSDTATTISSSYTVLTVPGYNGQISISSMVGSGTNIFISNSFWNSQITTVSATAGSTGATTAELKTFSTFQNAGWDIEDGFDQTATWGIHPAVNDGYPFLTGSFSSDPTPTAPSYTGATSFNVAEGAVEIGTLTTTPSAQWSVSSDASGLFSIDSQTGELTVSPSAAAGSYAITVKFTGSNLGFGTQLVTITIAAPQAIQGSEGSAPMPAVPEITEFSSREIRSTGDTVTVQGRRLADVSSLTLGGISVTIVSNNATSITFTTGEMPVGTWDLRLVGANGTLTFQQAITIVGQEVALESTTGSMLGFTMTLRFTGNNRTLNVVQERNLSSRLDRFSTAETIICWGYTTAANPNAWAIAHATARAKAACDLAIGSDSALKSVVRLRYGVSKDFAMRAALQFWR